MSHSAFRETVALRLGVIDQSEDVLLTTLGAVVQGFEERGENLRRHESMFIFTMSDDERREALRFLRETYCSAINLESESTRRSAEVMMYALTEPLADCAAFFGPEDEWEHPCLCYECRTCG